MRDNEVHLSDQDLLLYADGELAPRRAAEMRGHLAACWSCRTRAADMEGAIADFVHLHQSRVDGQMPRGDGLRSSLRAQMAAATAAGPAPHLGIFSSSIFRQAACACVAVLILAAAAWKLHSGLLQPEPVLRVQARALPDRTLTPGYTRPVKISELCRRRQPNGPPDEDVSMELKVFREYGLPVSASKSYELDYLIAPDLGGADDARNLWPEPYGSTAWNAHVKDELEERLHTMVCDGQIDLATAQKDIATDWIAAYKRYFHTQTPLQNPGDGTEASADGVRIALLAGRFSTWSLPLGR